MPTELIALTPLALNGRRYRPGEVIEGEGGGQGDALIAAGAAALREVAAAPKATEPEKKDAETPKDRQARPRRTK